MLKSKKIRIFALIAALALLLTALPLGSALAAGIELYKQDASDNIADAQELEYLQMPIGHVGDKITVYVPIKNNTGGDITNVSCAPTNTADITKYPFEIEGDGTTPVTFPAYQQVSTGSDSLRHLVAWNGDTLKNGDHAYFKLDVTFSSSAIETDYNVDFTITYNGGTTTVITITVHCRGIDTSGSSSSGGSSYKSKPKVIVEAYTFLENPIYAGDTVQLRLIIANTSTREAVTNLQLDYTNEAGAVIPAPGGSSSVFLGTIEKNGVRAITLDLQIAPDADAKSQVLAVTLSYEGTKNRSDFEEKASVNVPILQKARVRINDPVIYDDPWVGSAVAIGVTLYNLGKSSLYNCMVDVTGDGFTLEETYFGGNVAAGGTMRADLSITPTVAGEISGNVRVTYEDVYGNQTEELMPLTMIVNEDTPADMVSPGDGAEVPSDQPTSGSGWIFWMLGGIAVTTGLVVLGIRLKKKRERELEDL